MAPSEQTDRCSADGPHPGVQMRRSANQEEVGALGPSAPPPSAAKRSYDSYFNGDLSEADAATLGQSMYMDKYRLHPSTHEDSKNHVSKRQVISNVLKQQLVQVAMVTMVMMFKVKEESAISTKTSYLKLASQITVAMVWFDLWQYAWHRALHANRFLYRHLHSWHHRLVVPYSFGALYGHPLESFITDTIGGTAAFLVSGMSPRASIFFFSLCTIKVIDNRCGLSLLPSWDRMSFWNNAAYHDVHHQLRGGKYNYSQLFFVVWDRIFGTYMPFLIEDREGMLQVRAPGLDYRRSNK